MGDAQQMFISARASRRWAYGVIPLVILVCCLATAATAFAAVASIPPLTAALPNVHEAGEAGRWGLLIAFSTLVLPSVLAWYVSRARARKRGTGAFARGFRRLLVGEDNRTSTSKTIAAVWTYLLAIVLLSIIITKWMGHGESFGHILHSGLEGQYGLLIGGPLGAAIMAKGIVGSQVANDVSARQPELSGPSVSDLIANDAGDTDLGDLQYVLFNFVAMIFFLGTVLQSPQDGLPHIPDVLLGLTSVSAVGYVGKKALPSVTPTAAIGTSKTEAGKPVTITGKGLLANELPTAPVRVLFGSAPATITNKETANGTDTLTVTVPAGLTADKAVEVIVVTPAGAQVKAGSFTLEA